MFNNKYGDEGLTTLFKEEISKASIELDVHAIHRQSWGKGKNISYRFDRFRFYFNILPKYDIIKHRLCIINGNNRKSLIPMSVEFITSEIAGLFAYLFSNRDFYSLIENNHDTEFFDCMKKLQQENR